MRPALVSLMTVCALGCATPQTNSQAPAPACAAPSTASSFDSSRVDSLAGDYTLILFADSFPSAGAHTVGRLRLYVSGDTARSVTRPLVGTLQINLDAIFAPYSNDPRYPNPGAPGVFFETASHEFKIGVQPNLTDGMSTSLLPLRTWPGGFQGRWSPDYGIATLRNSQGNRAYVGGEFCAIRRKK